MSLTSKTTIGVFWNFIEQVSRRGVQVFVTLLLAYFLSVEDFGLVAMIAVFLALANSLMDSGFQAALIRLKAPSQIDFSTAFYANIILGCVAYVLLYVSAPFIALFYNEPKILELIRVVGIVVIINSFQVVQVSKLSRDMKFSTLLKVNLPAAFLSGVLAVLLAYLGYGVWALIVQMVISSTLVVLFLWWQKIWRPCCSFSKKSLLNMYGFGYKLFLSGVIDIVFKNLYIIVIGKLFSIAVVGLYYFADRIKEMIVMQLVTAIQNVTYPALATKQNDEIQLKAAYKKLVCVMTFILFPFIIFFVVFCDLLFDLFLPEKWNEAVIYLQLMLMSSVLMPLHSVNLNILKVMGRTDLFLWLEVIKKTLLALILFVTIDYGVVAVLYGQIILSILGYFINSYYSSRLIQYSIFEQVSDFFPSLLISCLIAGFAYSLQLYIEWLPVVELIIFGGTSILLYVIFSHYMRVHAYILTKKLLIDQLNNKGISL